MAVALPHRGVQSVNALVERSRDIRSFGKVVLGLELSEAQQRMATMTGTINTRIAGRRVGKSVATLTRALWYLLTNPRQIWYVTAPSIDQAKLYYDEVEYARERSDALEALITDTRLSPYPEVRFRNGSVLRVRPAGRGLRGRGANGVIVTEAAYVPEDVYTQVLRALVLDRNGLLEFESTPNGPSNWTTRLFEMGKDLEQHRYRSQHATVYENPLLDRDEIEAIRRELPEYVWRAEYLAEIIDDAEAVFGWPLLMALFAEDYHEQEAALPYHRYWMGVDLAQVHDFCVLTVLDVSPPPPYRIAAWERFRGLPYVGPDSVVSHIEELRERFGRCPVSIDATMERAVAESVPMAEAVIFNGTVRTGLLSHLVIMCEGRELALPAGYTQLRDEMRYMRRYRLATGYVRADHPRDGFDDCVWSLALACRGIERGGPLGTPSSLNRLRNLTY